MLWWTVEVREQLFKNPTQVFVLDSKLLYLLSHLVSPVSLLGSLQGVVSLCKAFGCWC